MKNIVGSNTSMKKCTIIIILLLLGFCGWSREINIMALGAKPDSLTNNTEIIQSAINQLTREGGGRVIVPTGKFITGSLFLKSNVELHFEPGAVLIGSKDPADYPENGKGLIYARGQKNISITGRGTINGRGNEPVWQRGDNASGRPKIIYFLECENVLVEDVLLTNSAFWVSHYRKCNYVRIDGVRIYSYGNHNNDGMDIDSRNVVVSNCLVESDDDALCFKSDSHDFICENITVTNCVLASNCNAIKFGTASHGGFENISVTNCVIKRPAEDQIRQWNKSIEGIDSGNTVISGIALESVDGGIMDRIKISDIVMDGVQTPIFIKLGDRKRYNNTPGQLKNIQIDNIVARNASLISSSITGFPGNYIENVSLNNIDITYKGGGLKKHYEYHVPEKEKSYPENRMYGHYLPAYGFFIRHVRNLTLQNIHLSLAQPDYRSVIRMVDVAEITINDLKADTPDSNVPLIEINNGNNITIAGTVINKKHAVFLSANSDSKNIRLINNDFSKVEKIAGNNLNNIYISPNPER